jgi:transcriptional regulator with PAS, ATPase and Fis domain
MYLRNSLRQALSNVMASYCCGIPLLIIGETGTGKEILATKLHEQLGKKGTFVTLLSTCIPENLFESELFGYKRGAFTGAVKDKEGIIEKANNGTLFIDEVANLPLQMQSKFLRVLETKLFRRLGETRERKANFRLMCATSANLERLKTHGVFRADLYFRLKGKTVTLPPLRDCRGEIMPLLEFFLNSLKKDIEISGETTRFLINYDWPGNVRELKRFAEVCPQKATINMQDLPMTFFETKDIPSNTNNDKSIKFRVLQYNKELIVDYLKSGRNLKDLCKQLEKSEPQVRRILKKMGISYHGKRGRPRKPNNNVEMTNDIIHKNQEE